MDGWMDGCIINNQSTNVGWCGYLILFITTIWVLFDYVVLGHGPGHLPNVVNVMSNTLHGFVLGLW
jgi:hypothetical protein